MTLLICFVSFFKHCRYYKATHISTLTFYLFYCLFSSYLFLILRTLKITLTFQYIQIKHEHTHWVCFTFHSCHFIHPRHMHTIYDILLLLVNKREITQKKLGGKTFPFTLYVFNVTHIRYPHNIPYTIHNTHTTFCIVLTKNTCFACVPMPMQYVCILFPGEINTKCHLNAL